MNLTRRELVSLIFTLSSISLFKPRKTYAINTKRMPDINEKAPYFDLTGSSIKEPDKNNWTLDDFNDKWLVLYFYPKDFTSGCTLEARGFKNIEEELVLKDVRIVGVSADNISDHQSFCSEEKLNYPLLSDKNGETSRNYGSWQSPYSTRNTFLIDSTGTIRYRWIGVRPSKHAMEVLSKIDEIK